MSLGLGIGYSQSVSIDFKPFRSVLVHMRSKPREYKFQACWVP